MSFSYVVIETYSGKLTSKYSGWFVRIGRYGEVAAAWVAQM